MIYIVRFHRITKSMQLSFKRCWVRKKNCELSYTANIFNCYKARGMKPKTDFQMTFNDYDNIFAMSCTNDCNNNEFTFYSNV